MVMTQGHPHAEWLGGVALAPEFEPAGLLVRDPAVGPDIVQALQHQSRRDEQGADLGDHLGHHRERDDRQPFQLGLECRDATAPEGVILRHGITDRGQGESGRDRTPGLPFHDLAGPGACLGDGVVIQVRGRRIAHLPLRRRRRRAAPEIGLHHLALSAQEVIHRLQESEHGRLVVEEQITGVDLSRRPGRKRVRSRVVLARVREQFTNQVVGTVTITPGVTVLVLRSLAESIPPIQLGPEGEGRGHRIPVRSPVMASIIPPSEPADRLFRELHLGESDLDPECGPWQAR